MVNLLEAVGAVKGTDLTHGCQPVWEAHSIERNGIHFILIWPIFCSLRVHKTNLVRTCAWKSVCCVNLVVTRIVSALGAVYPGNLCTRKNKSVSIGVCTIL